MGFNLSTCKMVENKVPKLVTILVEDMEVEIEDEVTNEKEYIRYHWRDEEGFHIVAVFKKIDQGVIYLSKTHHPMTELEYTNRTYGKMKIAHKEKELTL